MLDQLSKGLMRGWIVPDPDSHLTVLPFFNLVHAWNTGVSFSLFAHDGEMTRWALVLVMGGIGAVVAWWLWRTSHRLPAVAYGLILGGALGNVVDRIVFGAVFDFLQFHLAGYYWPSFNLADSGIVVGVGLLLADGFWRRENKDGHGGRDH